MPFELTARLLFLQCSFATQFYLLGARIVSWLCHPLHRSSSLSSSSSRLDEFDSTSMMTIDEGSKKDAMSREWNVVIGLRRLTSILRFGDIESAIVQLCGNIGVYFQVCCPSVFHQFFTVSKFHPLFSFFPFFFFRFVTITSIWLILIIGSCMDFATICMRKNSHFQVCLILTIDNVNHIIILVVQLVQRRLPNYQRVLQVRWSHLIYLFILFPLFTVIWRKWAIEWCANLGSVECIANERCIGDDSIDIGSIAMRDSRTCRCSLCQR